MNGAHLMGWIRTACFVLLVVVGLGRAAEAAQGSLPRCARSDVTDGQPGAHDISLDGAPQSRLKPFAGTYTVPQDGCVLKMLVTDVDALPGRASPSYGWRLLVQAVDDRVLLRLELRGTDDAFVRGSDVAASDQQLAIPVPMKFEGSIRVIRADLNAGSTTDKVRLSVIPERLEGLKEPKAGETDGTREGDSDAVFLGSLAAAGQAFVTDVESDQYEDLARLALDYRARRMSKPASTARAYELLNDLLGRRIEAKPIEFATRSEPIVAFIGISGMSRLVLLDCQALPMPATKGMKTPDCNERLSRPWQTTFERARHFWVAYVEDAQSAWDTSMDLEFGSTRVPDFDDFDAQNMVRLVTLTDPAASATPGKRRVRVGYRRFAMPTRIDAVKVTISRQGSAYGLRSWSRSYERYGPFPFRVAGALALPGWRHSRSVFTLAQVFGTDAFNPVGLELVESKRTQPVFATAFLRYPQLRAAADQSGRTWRSFFPEIGGGVAFPTIANVGFRGQTFLVAASWPLAWRERTHFWAGYTRSIEQRAIQPVGSRLPLGIPLGQVAPSEAKWHPMVGLSLDLARTP
jgi:hypothetical protein